MSESDDKDLQSQDILQDVDVYINYYGLTGDPFNSDNPLFFASPQLEKILRLFNYLARFSRKLVVVTGDDGAGKTALLENFVNEQDDQELLCFFTALNADTPKQVLYEIASQLGIDADVESESLEQLTKVIRDYSLQRLEQGKNCIVVIDDAHLFENPVLEQLYQLTFDAAGQRSAISMLLGGLQSLIERVQTIVPSEIESKALFHQPISPLNHDEMVQYLRLHFRENAGQNKPPFSGADYQQIYQQSEGLPGRVNEQAKELLIAGVSRLVSGSEAKKNSKVFVALIAVILLAVVGVFLWSSSQQVDNDSGIAVLEMTGKIEREEEVGAVKENEGDFLDAQIFAEPEQPQAIPGALDSKTAGETSELVSSPSNEGELDTLQLERALDASAGKVEVDAVYVAENSEGSVAKAVDNVEAIVAVLPEAEKNTEAEVPVTSEEASINANLEQAPIQASDVVVQPTKQSSSLSRNIDNILAFPPSEYTLQLLGSRKEESITASKAKIPGSENALYFEKQHKGAPWYVLIYGHYADRATAKTAAATLSAKLKGIKPWIRKVSDIQSTIKANQ
ncbi:MAG: AAA family ATPase [Pseudomonadales bacterium]